MAQSGMAGTLRSRRGCEDGERLAAGSRQTTGTLSGIHLSCLLGWGATWGFGLQAIAVGACKPAAVDGCLMARHDSGYNATKAHPRGGGASTLHREEIPELGPGPGAGAR